MGEYRTCNAEVIGSSPIWSINGWSSRCGMTIVEAEKRCKELNEQIFDIRQEYDFGSYARYCGDIKNKPLQEELCKLILAIVKAKATTEIEI